MSVSVLTLRTRDKHIQLPWRGSSRSIWTVRVSELPMVSRRSEMPNGVIYILTNPSFPEYVKIGYADNMEQRLRQLNNSECTPFAFRVYATYEVENRLTDLKLHGLIDKLNPDLRSIDTVEGKKRVREFYAMSPEDAYEILEAIAGIHGFEDRLVKWKMTKQQKEAEEAADEIKRGKAAPFRFSMCNLSPGDKIEYCNDSSLDIEVLDDKHVMYDGNKYTLTGLARELHGKKVAHIAGPKYFKYNGRWLNSLREK
jgi:hypothetical protein